MHRFAKLKLRFPKRAYGGAWDGKLLWGRLTDGRVRDILKNPQYAGADVYGRYQSQRTVSAEGEIQAQVHVMPMADWRVNLRDHHEGYLTWEAYLGNPMRWAKNRTNGEATVLSGPAREGLALLQGLLLCGTCGRKLSVRYRGNGGLYPTYECNWRRREGLATKSCIALRCDRLDTAVVEQALQILQPAQLELAVEAVQHLEARNAAVARQWTLRLERARYEAQLAERRYEAVDPLCGLHSNVTPRV